ncbi:hypothetical protein LTR53_019533, partial [Teratosphaeriaceae sp. CCFEE 6253]
SWSSASMLRSCRSKSIRAACRSGGGTRGTTNWGSHSVSPWTMRVWTARASRCGRGTVRSKSAAAWRRSWARSRRCARARRRGRMCRRDCQCSRARQKRS